MCKNLLATLVLAALSASAFAAEPTPAIQYSRDANYIYIKQPLRLTFDAEQQAALKEAAQFMEGQLLQLNALSKNDPNGDLKGLNDAVDALNKKIDLLVNVSGKLYGEVAPFGFQYFQALPTAAVIFAGVNADKNILRFVQVGGSATLMGVFVPMQVTRISIKNPKDKVSRIDFRENSSLMLMGLGLGAMKITPAAVAGAPAADAPNTTNKNARVGVGLVWGELNSSSDLVGAIGGGTMTVNIGVGVNGKILALKNPSKSGAVNNYILLVGVQRAAELNSKIPFTDIGAEFGANGGGILDLGSSIASSKNLMTDFGALITGNRGKEADQ